MFKILLPLCSFFVIAQQPVFDGIVSAEEWQDAQQFSIPYEIEPSDNGPAHYKTEVFVHQVGNDLFVGFIAFANMNELRSSIRSRDQIGGDDNVAIGIDTYGDGRNMIVLGSNPDGSQFDLKIIPNGNNDEYNLFYETKASKHDNAYHVEFKIPISGLQFTPAETLEWAVVFGRSGYANNTRIQMINFAYDRSNPCVVCQTPDRVTLHNVTSNKRINLLPYVFLGQAGYRENGDFQQQKTKGTIGLSGLFDLSSNTTLELTLNPDFSQIEADVSQIDANNTFALFFPEKRPYFNEGNDIINSNQEAVYTRSINNPIASTKLIHQGKNQRLYWLTAYDENAPYLIAGENQSYSGEGNEAWANILSYQRTFEGGSHLGFLSTNRFFHGGGHGQLMGINSRVRIADQYSLNVEWNFSSVEEPIQDWIESNDMQGKKTVALDGESKNGDGLFVSLDRTTKHWNTFFYYAQYSPNFETPLGFVTQNNLRNAEFVQQYVAYPKSKNAPIQQFRVNLGSELSYNYEGTPKYVDLFSNANIVWKGNWESQLNIVRILEEEYEGFVGQDMMQYSMYNGYSPSEAIRLRSFVSIGDQLRYDEENPAVGKQFFIGSFNSFQLTPKLRIGQSIRYSQMRSKEDNSLFYKGYIARFITNYQFNKDLSFRLVSEYNEFDDTLFIQPLLKWNPNPFTVLFVGGSQGYGEGEIADNLDIDSSQLYFKFQYLFEI